MRRSELPNPARFWRGHNYPTDPNPASGDSQAKSWDEVGPPKHPVIKHQRGVPHRSANYVGVEITVLQHQDAFGTTGQRDPRLSRESTRPADGVTIQPLSSKLRYVTMVVKREIFESLPVCWWEMDDRGRITRIEEITSDVPFLG